MKEVVDKIKKVIQKHNEETQQYGSTLFYDFFVNPEISTELMIGPIGVTGGMERAIAKKIAEKSGVKVKEYDFSRGKWSNPRDYRLVFSIAVPYDGTDFDSLAEKLCAAQKELREAFSRLVTI